MAQMAIYLHLRTPAGREPGPVRGVPEARESETHR